jgi:hypothetical protein
LSARKSHILIYLTLIRVNKSRGWDGWGMWHAWRIPTETWRNMKRPIRRPRRRWKECI